MPLPHGYSIRPVSAADHRQYSAVLAVLTTVGEVSHSQFAELVAHWHAYPDIYHPRVITDAQNNVVATGMLFVERKLIHGCGKVGHIEDIAVAKTQQGRHLGNEMIGHLSALAADTGCYKVILDCAETNVGFYEKCGYAVAGVEMARRYD